LDSSAVRFTELPELTKGAFALILTFLITRVISTALIDIGLLDCPLPLTVQCEEEVIPLPILAIDADLTGRNVTLPSRSKMSKKL
jgi:hypothetical protein